jgi:hypothetical protein
MLPTLFYVQCKPTIPKEMQILAYFSLVLSVLGSIVSAYCAIVLICTEIEAGDA